MKKVLLVVALLLFATTVFAADVTITATKVGIPTTDPNQLQKVAIGFTGLADDNLISAFALTLTVSGGTNLDHIADFNRGESKSHGGGFGIFPGKFRDVIQVLNGTDVNTNPPYYGWADGNYNPLAPATDPCAAGTGNDNPKMIVELGSLFVGDANKPALNGQGTLFTVDVNAEHQSDCNLCIALEQTRGGVVKRDATAATVTLPPGGSGAPAGCIKIVFATTPVCTVPNIVGLSKTAAESAITSAGFTIGTETGAFSDTTPVQQVTVQSPASGSQPGCGTAVTLTYICRTVHCLNPYCKGDVNKDKYVRSTDISALGLLISSYPAPTYRAANTVCAYEPCGDINGDNYVRSTDISALGVKVSGFPSPTYRCSCGTTNCPYYVP